MKILSTISIAIGALILLGTSIPAVEIWRIEGTLEDLAETDSQQWGDDSDAQAALLVLTVLGLVTGSSLVASGWVGRRVTKQIKNDPHS